MKGQDREYWDTHRQSKKMKWRDTEDGMIIRDGERRKIEWHKDLQEGKLLRKVRKRNGRYRKTKELWYVKDSRLAESQTDGRPGK